jgi:hypothetical protein
VLLEQKHELEYKLNKTNELSEQQIRDLEETVENYNKDINLIKRKILHFRVLTIIAKRKTKAKRNFLLFF